MTPEQRIKAEWYGRGYVDGSAARESADSGGLNAETLWYSVMLHVRRVEAHRHDRNETCGEAVLREYAALATAESSRE